MYEANLPPNGDTLTNCQPAQCSGKRSDAAKSIPCLGGGLSLRNYCGSYAMQEREAKRTRACSAKSGEGSLFSQLLHTQHTMSLYSVPPSQTQSQASSSSSVHMQQHQQQHSPIDLLSSPHYVPDMSHSCHTSVSSPELLRCKRRVDFNELGYSLSQPPPATVARRNERERNRVKMVNNGFSTLRNHVPHGAKNKKMSKVDTLRSAVDYIKQLQQLLHNSPQTSSSSLRQTDCHRENMNPSLQSSSRSPSPCMSLTDSTYCSSPEDAYGSYKSSSQVSSTYRPNADAILSFVPNCSQFSDEDDFLDFSI